MSDSSGWYARLRPEYRWPYPTLEPQAWYAVEARQSSLSPPGWLWLAAEPYRVEAFAEHLLPLRRGPSCSGTAIDGESDAPTEARVARLRESAAERFPAVPAGVWLQAADVAALASGRDVGQEGRRRVRRLSDEHFEFRSEIQSGV